MAEIKIDRERCKGCRLCVEFCKNKCISIESGYNQKGYRPACYIADGDKIKCSGCAVCGLVCPDVAIEVWR